MYYLEGFFHADREITGGESDRLVLWLRHNSIEGIRLFVPKKDLPDTFSPVIQEHLKRRVRLTKFAPQKDMTSTTLFKAKYNIFL